MIIGSRRVEFGCVDLVLWPRHNRTLTVLAGVYIGVPVVVFVVSALALSILTSGVDWIANTPTASLLRPLAMHALVAHLLVLAWMGSPCGPLMVATKHGVWIRARRWPARLVYLPWSSTVSVTYRRWLFDHAICIHADITSDHIDSLPGRVDVGLQRALFGAHLTASTFWSGRRPAEVLETLLRMSANRAVIDTAGRTFYKSRGGDHDGRSAPLHFDD